MRALLDGAFTVIFATTAPEDALARVIFGLQLQPDVESIDGTAREKVADLARAADNINAHGFGGLQCHARFVDRRSNGADITDDCRAGLFRLFANGKRCVRLRRFPTPHHLGVGFLSSYGAGGEDVDGNEARSQKLFSYLKLVFIFVREGNGRVRAGEAMRVNFSVNVARVMRIDKRHVTIGAIARFGRVIKRARALPRYATRLPVVVLIKPTEPAIFIYGH